MHELSLAQSLVEDIVAAARREGADRIVRVRLAVGALSGVDADAFEFAFPVAAEGSLAAGAELEIRAVALSVRCRDCGAVSSPDPLLCRCEACGSASVDVAAGRELKVEALEIHVPVG
jgi:hydrogenase nickel incorporation protein HypA/HybF